MNTSTMPRGRGSVTVLIPAKNEAKNIGRVLAGIPDWVDEILVVDGESRDETVAVVQSVRPEARIVIDGSPGKGNALRIGFEAAKSDYIVMLDADCSMDPAEIQRYVALLESGFHLVKGSRCMAGGGSSDITWLRSAGNRGLTIAANALFRERFTDLCYGYCAFRRDLVGELKLDATGFEIEAQLITRASRAGLRITEVPSFEAERNFGESNLRTFRDGFRVAFTMMREWRRPTPTVVFEEHSVIDLTKRFEPVRLAASPGSAPEAPEHLRNVNG